MGNTAIRAFKPITRNDQAGGPRATAAREADAYNPSRVALEFENGAVPSGQQPMPRLVSRPAMAGAPQMFKSADLLNYKKNSGSQTVSFLVHAAAIGLLVWWGMTAHNAVHVEESTVTPIKFVLTDPPPAVMPVAKADESSDGGVRQIVNPIKTPAALKAPHIRLMPAQIAPLEHPRLAAPPPMQASIPESANLPKIGLRDSPQVALSSPGPGAHSGLGAGFGSGIGNGHGSGGGLGGGLMSVGGGVSAPILIHSVEPEFTEEARRSSYQGAVSIQLIVDSQGNPQDAHVVKHLGMGLDEKALDAVRQYRFKPAMYEQQPVAVQMEVEIDFRLH